MWNLSKGHENLLPPVFSPSASLWELEGISKGHHWSRLYNPPSWQASTYIHLYLPMCFFLLTACLNVHVENTISLLTLTARQTCCNRSSHKVGSTAETLPICGAWLGPSHLNLAGLTWNSLPVGLPQTLPLSQGRRPHSKLQQLISDTPPEHWLQLTFRYLSRKREMMCFFMNFCPLSWLNCFIFSKYF